jgi:hypothetical protein
MTDNRNPYISESGCPSLQHSVVAFLDILGYRQMILKANEQNSSQEFLKNLHRTLVSAVNHLRDPLCEANEIFKSSVLDKDLHKVVTFTDNIVIAYPIIRYAEDAEWELGQIFSQIANYQLTLAKAGFFVRGAITIGDIYIDDYVVYGQGLVDAYTVESTRARDPRVILADAAHKATKKHLMYYSDPSRAPQVRQFFRDTDSQLFVNYLEQTMIAEYELGPDFESIIQHKRAVERKLKDYTGEPELWSKFAWVANYHNYFCNLFTYFNDEHKIDLSNFQMRQSLLYE